MIGGGAKRTKIETTCFAVMLISILFLFLLCVCSATMIQGYISHQRLVNGTVTFFVSNQPHLLQADIERFQQRIGWISKAYAAE